LVVSEGFCVFEQDTLKVLADRILVPESFAAQHGGTSGALSFAKQRSGELEASLSTLTVGSHEWSDAEQELKSLRAMEQCLHSH
jgi:hypothetical protein